MPRVCLLAVPCAGPHPALQERDNRGRMYEWLYISYALTAVWVQGMTSLRHQPEDMLAHFQFDLPTFSMFLHHNYLSFVDEDEELSSLWAAADNFSTADVLSSSHSSAQWRDIKAEMQPYAASVATRGIMHAHRNTESRKFTPLYRPSGLRIRCAPSAFLHTCAPPLIPAAGAMRRTICAPFNRCSSARLPSWEPRRPPRGWCCV